MINARKKSLAALTLLELMVVLVILAIVATVALQSLQPQVDSQRFDAATQLLAQLRSASIGPTEKYQLDGTPLISGFVSDVGRLPLATAQLPDTSLNGIDTQQQTETLSELWDPQTALAESYPYGFRSGPTQPVDYSAIRIPCGWRGPYMQLPIGMNNLKDPWSRPPVTLLGANGETESIQIEVPLTANQEEPQLLSVDLLAGKVNVTGKVLLNAGKSANVLVALLAPSPDSSLTNLTVFDDEDPMPDTFLFRDVPIGMRAIVCDVNGMRKVKYLLVPHTGLTTCFDFQTQPSTDPPPTTEN